MINWVDLLAKAWGRHLNRIPDGWPKQSAMWNVAFQSVSGGAEISIPNTHPEVLQFHRAWHEIPGKHREVLWNHYIENSSLNKSSADHRDRLTAAHRTVIKKLIESDGAANG